MLWRQALSVVSCIASVVISSSFVGNQQRFEITSYNGIDGKSFCNMVVSHHEKGPFCFKKIELEFYKKLE